MGSTDFSVGLRIGTTAVDDTAIIYFAYGVMWDRGSRLDVLIRDPGADLHRALGIINGTPTPEVTFQLQWQRSATDSKLYKNVGTSHKLHVLKVGQLTTPEGLCIRMRCVDRAYLALRSETAAFSAGATKAHQFLLNYLDKRLNLAAAIPETGDRASTHRTMHGKPIGQIRYELDRVLSAGGKPLSLQFDDRADKQRLIAFEEGEATQPLESQSHGDYVYGLGLGENGALAGAGWGNSIYHYEMDQNFESVMWGHKVSVSHLTSDEAVVVGSKTSALAKQLGVQGKLTDSVHRRLHLPRATLANPTEDDYYANALMVNATYHAQMSATAGYALIDPDYKAFDDVGILNRKHVRIAITGGTNKVTGNALLPQEGVVMGYQHVVNRLTAKTKLFLRRGTK